MPFDNQQSTRAFAWKQCQERGRGRGEEGRARRQAATRAAQVASLQHTGAGAHTTPRFPRGCGVGAAPARLPPAKTVASYHYEH